MEAALSAVGGGLGVIVLGLVAMIWRNGNGRRNGMTLEAKMDEALLVLREMRTILDERLPRNR